MSLSAWGEAAPLATATLGLVALGAAERLRHHRALRGLRLRIHVNGTRGKSSTTRLIAAGLRAAGHRTVAKTTGSLPRLLLPDGNEVDIARTSRPNIIEQRDVVAYARALGAHALVLECMALRPRLQWLCEQQLVRASHAVITNVRPDHLEVMGPGEEDVARALAGMLPQNGVLVTHESKHLDILAHVARARNTKVVCTGQVRFLPAGVTRSTLAPPSAEEMANFRHHEHADNVAVALAVLHDVGVPRGVALTGMWAATPDVGAWADLTVDFFGRAITFVNGFAANDPVSTALLWQQAHARFCAAASTPTRAPSGGRAAQFLLVNCRADRPERSAELARAAVGWVRPQRIFLMGRQTHVFVRAWLSAGGPEGPLRSLGDASAAEVFEALVEEAGAHTLIVGVGNIGGEGLKLVRHFHNRVRPPPAGDDAAAALAKELP